MQGVVQTKWEVLPDLEYAECLELVYVHDQIRGDYYSTRYLLINGRKWIVKFTRLGKPLIQAGHCLG